MSRSDAQLVTQRVNAAVGVAVRRKVNETTSVDNRRALEHSIGQRIQGAYGADLRLLAQANSDFSATQLAEAVIFPVEYPWDDAPEPTLYTGDRDRARQAHPNAPSPVDENWPDCKLAEIPGWADGLAAAKASVTDQIVTVGPPELISDPEHIQHVGGLRSALRTGTEAYGFNRRSRLERTNQ